MCIVTTTLIGVQQATGFATLYWGAEVVWNICLSSTFRPSFLSRSYQRPEDGLGSDEAEGLVERQDGAAEWTGG
jgi:hypothetical protein